MSDNKICQICTKEFNSDKEGGTIPERTGSRGKVKMVTKCQGCLDKTKIVG